MEYEVELGVHFCDFDTGVCGGVVDFEFAEDIEAVGVRSACEEEVSFGESQGAIDGDGELVDDGFELGGDSG